MCLQSMARMCDWNAMGCHMLKHSIGIHGTGDWVSQCNGSVRIRVGQVNRITGAISGAV